MINRVLRDDPAKGLSAMQMKIQWADVRAAWSDPHLWLIVFVGLVACEWYMGMGCDVGMGIDLIVSHRHSAKPGPSVLHPLSQDPRLLDPASQHAFRHSRLPPNRPHAGYFLLEWLLQREVFVSRRGK